jgi:hypothetical protein
MFPAELIIPPSAQMTCPKIQAASSLHRNVATIAMLEGVPSRRNAVPLAIAERSSSEKAADISVSVVPGAIALTVMPRAPSSMV